VVGIDKDLGVITIAASAEHPMGENN
jgi:hypothetical protein